MKKPKFAEQETSLKGIAIASYSEEEFALLKRTAKDASTLDDTYADWQANVENAKRGFEKAGAARVVHVPLTVLEIVDYCVEFNLENVGATRAQLAHDKVMGKWPKQGKILG